MLIWKSQKKNCIFVIKKVFQLPAKLARKVKSTLDELVTKILAMKSNVMDK